MTALVVIPTFQEAENVQAVLDAVRAAAPEADVLVVDDNSPDGTAELAEKAAVSLGGIHVLRRPGKAGLGRAYRAGFRWGIERGYDVLLEMDADLQHDPSVVPLLIAAVDRGDADLAIGSRYVPGGAVPGWPFHRRLLSQIGNRYIGIMLRLPVRDATAGFRAYTSDILERIHVDDITADGYAFQIEMAYAVAQAGGRIIEVPITFRDRTKGRSKMSPNIVSEALGLVTRWGVRDRMARIRR